jgi:hypothetical protein
VGTEDTAIAFPWPEQCTTRGAGIDVAAGVHLHGLGGLCRTHRTGERRGQDHRLLLQESGELTSEPRRVTAQEAILSGDGVGQLVHPEGGRRRHFRVPPDACWIEQIDIPGRFAQAERSLPEPTHLLVSIPPLVHSLIAPQSCLPLRRRQIVVRKHRHPDDQSLDPCSRPGGEELLNHSMAPETRASGGREQGSDTDGIRVGVEHVLHSGERGCQQSLRDGLHSRERQIDGPRTSSLRDIF